MKNKKGFTLVELLAVIAILAILVIIALPNVMGMFNSAKKSSFTTELKEVYKVAQQQWMMDSMTTTGDQVYSRCKTCTGKSLQLSGRSELEYYIKIDKAGKVVQYYATDGTYQFSYDGDLLATQINDVEEIAGLEEDEIIKISNSGAKGNKPFEMVDQKTKGVISRGDEFSIGSEHFFVVSSNENEVVALSKYDLLVGDNVEYINGKDVYTKVNHGSGYGLQDPNIGYRSGASATTGLVAFSGSSYWLNGNKINPEYGQSNMHPVRGVNIFRYEMSSIAPEVDSSSMDSNGVCSNFCTIKDNGYTIAYYVNQYVNALKGMGAENISGRLLLDSEIENMGCSLANDSLCNLHSTPAWVYSRSYWIDSLFSVGTVRHVENNLTLSIDNPNTIGAGVRPVIIIQKKDLKLITSNDYYREKEERERNTIR